MNNDYLCLRNMLIALKKWFLTIKFNESLLTKYIPLISLSTPYLYPKPTELKSLEMETGNLYFKKISRNFDM